MFWILLILWFIFNGRITLEVTLFGVVICGWLYRFMTKHMDYSLKRDRKLIPMIPGLIRYAVILVSEIVKSNIAVIKGILSPGLEIEPVFHTFHTDLKTELAQVALANSITLTPGTYTIGLENGEYLIHALDEGFVDGIEDSVFVKELRKLEGSE